MKGIKNVLFMLRNFYSMLHVPVKGVTVLFNSLCDDMQSWN